MPEPRRAGLSISTIVGERRLLGEVAERLLGSARDAEEVVRETYARWYAMPEDLRDEVGRPTAWLVRVASRLCLDRLHEARVHEARVHEARVHEARVNPPPVAARRPPGEPAALRPPACRHDRIVTTFRRACEVVDGAGELTALLAPGAAVITDGGGRVRVPLRPVIGSEQAARFILALFGGQTGVTFAEASISGSPGLVVRVSGRTAAVVVLHIGDARIQDVWIVINPDKLRAW